MAVLLSGVGHLTSWAVVVHSLLLLCIQVSGPIVCRGEGEGKKELLAGTWKGAPLARLILRHFRLLMTGVS